MHSCPGSPQAGPDLGQPSVQSRAVRRLLLVLPLVVALSGCSGGGAESKPVTLPPLTAVPSTSATPSPTVAPVKKPVEADEPTAEGAEAFALFWFAQLSRAFASMDTASLAAVSSRDCATCDAYIQTIQRAKEAGNYYEGAQFKIRSAAAPPLGEVGRATASADVVVDYDVSAATELNASGAKVREERSHKGVTVRMTLERKGSRWLVREVVQL